MSKREKSPDEELFRLHEQFYAAYQKMQKHEVPGKGNGSLSTGTKEEKRLPRKWENAVNVAFEKGRAVVDAPALTLDGMLMKLHVTGFSSEPSPAPSAAIIKAGRGYGRPAICPVVITRWRSSFPCGTICIASRGGGHDRAE